MRRTRFVIHLDHRVETLQVSSKLPLTDGSLHFSTEREFGKLAAHWPGKRLVQVWNRLPNTKKVIRFSDRKTALRRVWMTLQELKPADAGSAVGGPNGSTKSDRVVALLKRTSGASLRSIMELTGWQSHSVRGFISSQLSKRMGLKIQSFTRDGERVYRIRF